MGHSTGCQDAVRYAATFGDADDSPPIVGYILQACVSHSVSLQKHPALANLLLAVPQD